MIRDTFFSAPRFVNLCRKEMVESWKANLLRFVMMYGIMAIAFVWNGYFQYNHLQANGRVSQDPIWNFELGAFVWEPDSYVDDSCHNVRKVFLTLAGIYLRFPYRISNSFQTGGLDTCNSLYD